MMQPAQYTRPIDLVAYQQANCLGKAMLGTQKRSNLNLRPRAVIAAELHLPKWSSLANTDHVQAHHAWPCTALQYEVLPTRGSVVFLRHASPLDSERLSHF